MRKNIDIPWEAISKKLSGGEDRFNDHLLEEWLGCGPENRKLFAEFSTLWDEIRSRASAVNPDKEKLWDELRSRTIAKTNRRRMLRTGFSWAAAAFGAASLLFGAVWFFQFRSGEGSESAGQIFENISGKSRVAMPDGSQVWLHNDTQIACGDGFGNRTRDIILHGEAFFDVTHDPANPFTVFVNGLKIEVLGTKFNVRPYPDGERVMVGLLEGSVLLSAGETACHISPGETALYDRTSGTISVEQGDVYFESLWASDRMHIDGRPLGEICRYLEKWYNTSIKVDPAATGAYSYSFTITDEPLEEVLRIMNRINPIAYRFVENGGVTISLRSDRPD